MSSVNHRLLRDRLRRYFPSSAVIGSLVIVFGSWQLISMSMGPHQFPGLVHLFEGIWSIFTGGTQYDPIKQYGVTLIRIFFGFVIVMIAGSAVGIVMGSSPVIEDYTSTFTVVGLTVPSVVWAFLAVMWFGLTEYLVPIFVIVMIIFPYVVVNMWQGTKDIDPGLLEMATTFRLNRRDVWRHIYLPHLTPYTFSTMRLAFAISWKISLVAEIFGSNNGVGVVVNAYYQTFRTDMILAWAIPMMVAMLGIEQLFQYLERRSYKWKPNADSDTTEAEGTAV